MITYKEKLSLLSEMIALSRVDGILHENEVYFIKSIANDWKIIAIDLEELFSKFIYLYSNNFFIFSKT